MAGWGTGRGGVASDPVGWHYPAISFLTGTMGKLFKYLFLLALAGVLAGGGSYAGAYFAQGKIVGVEDPLGQRTVKLHWQGYDSLPGKPRAWVFRYSNGKVNGVRTAVIVVSLTGKVIVTKPADLDERVDRWHESRRSVE